MAKKRKVVDTTPHFYVYYLDDNSIVAVTNYKNTDYTNSIEVDFDQYERLVTGKDKFEDFHVGTVVDEAGNATLGIVSHRLLLDHSFKNRLLPWIDTESDTHDISIVWDEGNQHWMFSASKNLKERYTSNQLPVTEILFFVTLGNDPNFLIRTINIGLKDLITDPIFAKFNTTWESTIDSISITSNLAELSYSLNVWKIDDNN